jgi:anti-sigma regulatory factor (Ser/Thr protein kinase)
MNMPLWFESDDGGFQFSFSDASLAVQARKLLLLYLQGQTQPSSELFAAELVLGELVGNVVKHAPGPLDVRIRWLADGARLEVRDRGPGFELQPTLPDDAFAESHRGLFLVAAFADDLRVERLRDANVTSVTLRVRRNG